MGRRVHLERINILDRDTRNLSLIRASDSFAIMLFLISFSLSVIGAVLYTGAGGATFMDAMLFFALPFVIVGAYVCIERDRWYILPAVLVISILMFLAHIDFRLIASLSMICVGIIGAVRIVEVEQRAIFYKVVSTIEYMNIKSRLGLKERIVGFLFNISGDLDTRTITIDSKMHRAGIPFREVYATLSLCFMIGLFIWIYISMNPTWMNFESFSSVPASLFVLMLYFPLLVMPVTIFMSMNARIETKYRDFRLFDGIKSTLSRMAVPVFAAFMFILVAVNENGINDVLYFIVLSLIFNLFVNGLACILYYRYFESEVVTDIVYKWPVFRPVSMLMEVEDDKSQVIEELPDTPRRDTSDLGVLRFN